MHPAFLASLIGEGHLFSKNSLWRLREVAVSSDEQKNQCRESRKIMEQVNMLQIK